MNVHQYLTEKYDMPMPTTMLACEARAFGIPYPLKSGWLLAYGSREIDAAMRSKLIRILKASKKETAVRGLEVIEGATVD